MLLFPRTESAQLIFVVVALVLLQRRLWYPFLMYQHMCPFLQMLAPPRNSVKTLRVCNVPRLGVVHNFLPPPSTTRILLRRLWSTRTLILQKWDTLSPHFLRCINFCIHLGILFHSPPHRTHMHTHEQTTTALGGCGSPLFSMFMDTDLL